MGNLGAVGSFLEDWFETYSEQVYQLASKTQASLK